jgi:hypothetical protein
METGLENVPEIIECDGRRSGSWPMEEEKCNGRREGWPNISGVKFIGTVDRPFGGNKKYSYTFNNLWKNKATFHLELIGREFEYLESFKIVKTTTEK